MTSSIRALIPNPTPADVPVYQTSRAHPQRIGSVNVLRNATSPNQFRVFRPVFASTVPVFLALWGPANYDSQHVDDR